jgi:Holliday junction resolvase RusA-like endonuclease
MKLFINITGRGFSVNSAYTRNHALTAAARRWKLQFHKQMLSYQDDCALFSKSFDPFKHCIHAKITNYVSNLITKDGRVSHASNDVDNLNKLTLDSVFSFLPTLDDCAITKLTSEKILAPEDSVSVELEILPIPK